jgi:hypothetical protein
MPEKQKPHRDAPLRDALETSTNNKPVFCADIYMESVRVLAPKHDEELRCADALNKDAAMATLYNPSQLTIDQ